MKAFALKFKKYAQLALLHFPIGNRRCDSAACVQSGKSWHRLRPSFDRVRLRGCCLCFPHCFERELRRIVDAMWAEKYQMTSKPRRIPLGLILLSRGSITPPQLRHALDAQTSAASRRIGEWLQTLGFAEEQEVAAALATQWSCPLLRKLPSQYVDRAIPARLLRRFRMLPIYFSTSRRLLHIALAGDVSYPALLAIEEVAGCKTEVCLTTEEELERGFERLEENCDAEEKLFENCAGSEEIVRIIANYIGRVAATEVRVAKCAEVLWVRIMLQPRPVDLLFSPGRLQADETHDAYSQSMQNVEMSMNT